jgi:hypothetical protein
MGFQASGHIPQAKGKKIGHPFDRQQGEKGLPGDLLNPFDLYLSDSKEWIPQEVSIHAMADEEREGDEEKG